MGGSEAGPHRFEGRSRGHSLSPSGRPSRTLATKEGPTTMILKGPAHFSESFSLRTLSSVPFYSPFWMLAAVSVVHPNHPPVVYFGLTEETIKEGRFAFVYPGDCEGVLFPHEFEGALLALVTKVPKGEMVAVEALMIIAV